MFNRLSTQHDPLSGLADVSGINAVICLKRTDKAQQQNLTIASSKNKNCMGEARSLKSDCQNISYTEFKCPSTLFKSTPLPRDYPVDLPWKDGVPASALQTFSDKFKLAA